MQKLGIVNVTKILVAIGALATVGGLVYADGEVTLGDIRYARQLLTGLKQFQGVDFRAALPEAKDIDAVEAAALEAEFANVFELPAHLKTTEERVEAGMGFLLMALEAIAIFIPSKDGVQKVPFKALAKAA